MGVAPPLLAREIAVTVAVAVAVAVAASAGVAFIDSSDGIHIVQKIVLEDGTDANKPLAPAQPLREVGSIGEGAHSSSREAFLPSFLPLPHPPSSKGMR